MLIITRTIDQTIKIGDNIEIMVVKIAGKQVQIGIKTPPEVEIFRGELTEGEKNKLRTRQDKKS